MIAAPYQRTRFPSIYTPADATLLAYVERAHANLSGPATRRILEREYSEYGQAAYQRLAGISVAHPYRLRNTAHYRKRNTSYQPTRPTHTNRRAAQATAARRPRISVISRANASRVPWRDIAGAIPPSLTTRRGTAPSVAFKRLSRRFLRAPDSPRS